MDGGTLLRRPLQQIPAELSSPQSFIILSLESIELYISRSSLSLAESIATTIFMIVLLLFLLTSHLTLLPEQNRKNAGARFAGFARASHFMICIIFNTAVHSREVLEESRIYTLRCELRSHWHFALFSILP